VPVRVVDLNRGPVIVWPRVSEGIVRREPQILDPMVVGAMGCVARSDLIKADGGRSDD
jgi:hypothetical protein